MMTIDDAIRHEEERAADLESTCTLWKSLSDSKGLALPSDYEFCKSDAEDHRQQGDLISREALKKALEEYKYCGFYDKLIEVIDNAPTVEYTFEEAFQKTVCENKLYCPARPKGEWEETVYETGALGIIYRQAQCSNCGWEHAFPMWLNFCPKCGADMRKGGAE